MARKGFRVVLAAAGLFLLAACGQGSDGISDIIGANPVSDARDIVHRSTNNGWTSTDAGRLESELQDLGLTSDQADCVRDFVLGTWSPSEWMASTEDDPEVMEMLLTCM